MVGSPDKTKLKSLSDPLVSLHSPLLDTMHDSTEPGRNEPPSELDKAKDLDETDKQPEINVDELELVVTPKTSVVVGVSIPHW